MSCLLIITGILHAGAQEASFTLVAGGNKMGIEDQIQVQYILKNIDNVTTAGPKPEIQNNFFIVSGPITSRNSQVSYRNGQMTQSQSIVLTYVLQPKKKGNLTIVAGTAKTNDGKEYESNSLQVEVVDGSIAAQQQNRSNDPWGDDPFDAFFRQRQQQARRQRQQQQQGGVQPKSNINLQEDLFIKVVVDKSKVHLGEQITATYKLYARVPMNVNISKLPSLNGFWTQDFEMPKGNIKPVEEIANGKRYQVFTLKKSALFPQQTGTLELDPAEAEGVARILEEVQGRDPFFDDPVFDNFMMDDPFFEDFFRRKQYRDVKVTLRSKPVKIQVDSLPSAEKPEGFTGAVGNFTVTSSIDKANLTTDDVASYKISIKGSGNLKLIEAPALNLPNGLTAYDPVIEDTITGRTTTISGTKTITYSITPTMPGEYNIPPIKFSYFDPKTNEFVTASTKAAKLKVTAGKNYSPDAPKNITLTDIHDINSSPIEELTYNSKPIALTVGYWSLYALPLIAFFGVIAWKRREDELSKDTASLKRRRANKIALKRLVTAKKLLEKNERTPFYEEVSKAIWLYLSDKLNIPLSSLSKDNVWDALNAKNITQDMQRQIASVMEECEIALYSGAGRGQKMKQTYQDAVDTISKLEESFKA